MKFKQKLLRIGIAGFLLLSIIGVNLFHVGYVAALAADAYWYGGTGAWSDYTNHWSNNSGDSPDSNYGGVPTSTTNVHFDANSFTGASQTVNIDITAYCASMDWTGVTNSPAIGGNGYFHIVNNLTLAAGVTYNFLTFNYDATGSVNITCNGATLSSPNWISFNSPGTYNLQDTFYAGGNDIEVKSGATFNSNNYAMHLALANVLFDSGSTVNLGSSVITVPYSNGSSIAGYMYASGTITGTSTLNMQTGSNPWCSGINIKGTWYDVNVTPVISTSQFPVYITGASTFHNLSIVHSNVVYLYADQIVTGTLTLTGYNSSLNRMTVGSSVAGTNRQMTVGAVAITNSNISDLWFTSSFNISAGLNSNYGNNMNLIFTPALNNYWVGNSGNWSDVTHWASTSGGTGGTGRIPLTQDTATFDGYSFTLPGRTVTMDVPDIGSIDTTAATNTPTLSGTTANIYGNITMGVITYTVATTTFKGGTNNTLISGSTLTTNLYISKALATASVTLGGNVTVVGTIYLSEGLLDLGNYNLTASKFDSSTTTYVRTLTMGSGIFTLNGTASGAKWTVASTNLTINCNTSTIDLDNSGTNGQTFTGAGKTYYNLAISGAGIYTLTFGDSNTLHELYVDRSVSAKTISGNITLTIVPGTTGGFYCPTNLTATLSISNIDIVQATGTIILDWLNFTSGANTCIASGGANFYAGVDSIGSPQTGWNFTSPVLPLVTTDDPPTNILTTSATLKGTVTSMGGYGTVYGFFVYGIDPSFVTYSSTSPTTTITGTGDFTFTVSGLSSGTTYYYAAAVSDGSTTLSYGTAYSFTTGAPIVTTLPPINSTGTSITFQGQIVDMSGYTTSTLDFQYGTTNNPTYASTTNGQTANGAGIYSITQTGLVKGTTYYVRVRVAVSGGVYSYGSWVSFTATNGSTIIRVQSTGVFSGYLVSNDLLFAAEVYNEYPPYYPSGSIYGLFTLQLRDTDDTTVLAVTPLANWGDRPISIYLNPTVAATLTYGSAYHLVVVGLFTNAPTPSTQPAMDYTLTADDWYGTDLAYLRSWCIGTATNMEGSDNQPAGTYVTSSTGNDTVITDPAGGYFTSGIPQIAAVLPSMFQVSSSQAQATLGAKNDVWSGNHVWATQVGSQIADDWNTIGSLIYGDTTHGASAMGYFLLIIAILICIFGVSIGGKGLPLLILSFPLLYWGTQMGALAPQWLLVPCVAMVMLWARQFWVKPT